MDLQPWRIVRCSVMMMMMMMMMMVMMMMMFLLLLLLLLLFGGGAAAAAAHVSLYDGGWTNSYPCDSLHVHHKVSSLSFVKQSNTDGMTAAPKF